MKHADAAAQFSRKGSAGSGRGRLTRLRGYIPLYLMLAPALIYVLINNYLPMGGLEIGRAHV